MFHVFFVNPLSVPEHQHCELNCRAVGFRFYVRKSERVIDGTPCGRNETSFCVAGTCMVGDRIDFSYHAMAFYYPHESASKMMKTPYSGITWTPKVFIDLVCVVEKSLWDGYINNRRGETEHSSRYLTTPPERLKVSVVRWWLRPAGDRRAPQWVFTWLRLSGRSGIFTRGAFVCLFGGRCVRCRWWLLGSLNGHTHSFDIYQ